MLLNIYKVKKTLTEIATKTRRHQEKYFRCLRVFFGNHTILDVTNPDISVTYQISMIL